MLVIADKKEPKSKTKERDTIEFKKLSDGLYTLTSKATNMRLKYTKEQIQKFINNNDIKKLREASRYFYNKSGLYKRLIHHFADMLTFDYLVAPKNQTHKRVKESNFEKSYYKVHSFLDNLFIKDSFAKINELVLTDGVFYGYLREEDENSDIQQLPSDYCRTPYKIDGNYAVEFNLIYFDLIKSDTDLRNILKQFPKEIGIEYAKYKNVKSGYNTWVQLNPENAMCFQFDDLGTPFFIGVLDTLIELEYYKSLEKSKDKLELTKILIQKLPLDDKKQMIFKLEEALQLHDNAKKMIKNNDNVDLITTPAEIDSISLQDKSSVSKDNLLKAERSVFNEAGVAQILFNSTGNLSLKFSVNSDESIMFRLLSMYEKWFNVKLDYLIESKNYNFSFTFLPITWYNRKEMIDIYLKNATYGYSKLLPVVASGVKQSTFISLLELENTFLDLHNKMIPLSNSHTQSGDENGRPESNEEDLSPKGSTTKDSGGNEGRA